MNGRDPFEELEQGDVGSAAGAARPVAPQSPAASYSHSSSSSGSQAASGPPLLWDVPLTSVAPGSPPDCPGPRAAHSCNVIDSRLYVFGGWNGKSGIDSLAVLDTRDGRCVWSCPETRGAGPSRRNNHASFTHNGRLYIHGGHDGTRWLGDLYCYVPETSTWSAVDVSGAVPSPRACHTITIIGKRAWLFGGFDGTNCYSDLLCLDMDTLTWGCPPPAKVGGTPPIARNAQTAVAVAHKLYLFGGHSGSKHLRDTCVFDTEALEWSAPELTGGAPPGLRGHTANLLPGERIVVMGGYDGVGRSNEVYILDTQARRWEHLPASESAPVGRQRHTAAVVRGSLLLVVGGFDGHQWLGDVHTLDLARWQGGLLAQSGVWALVGDLRAMVNNPAALPDVTFRVGGEGALVVAHRAILAARCAYFRAMFGSGMREAAGAQAEPVELAADVVTPAAFVALLQHLYTGAAPADLPPQTALEGLGAASYFAVEGLRVQCEAALLPVVDAHNVTALLLAAQRHGAPALKAHCMDFVVRHSAEFDFAPLSAEPLLLVEMTKAAFARARGST